ncbi:MAG: dihydroorotate dehydrogenase electron transfer subunit [Planctomycetota bacterium]
MDPRTSVVVSNRAVGPGWHLLRLRQPAIAAAARPGQFVQISCAEAGSSDPLLRRPFSVYAVDRAGGTYDILYTPVGRGTRWLAEIPDPEAGGPEAPLDVEGPFGNTFTAPEAGDRVYLVAGGVGVAPLHFFARELAERGSLRAAGPPGTPGALLLIGARTKAALPGIDDFRKLPVAVRAATEDGSEGYRGLVTELAAESLEAEPDLGRLRVYGCGPQGMNESLRALAVERGVRAEICLESLMACGFGVCFGCVAPIRKEVGGSFYRRRICYDGPVFDARLLAPGIEA